MGVVKRKFQGRNSASISAFWFASILAAVAVGVYERKQVDIRPTESKFENVI